LTIEHNFVTIIGSGKTLSREEGKVKQKDQYTLRELFDGLPIPLTDLSKLSGKSHGTLTRIRDGEPARRSTINKLLIVLSEVYGLDLSTDNVKGIVIEDRQQKAAEKAEKPPVLPSVQSAKVVTEKPQKRTYKGRDTGLPHGCILALDFARNHDVKRETFRDHMVNGLGPGLIGTSTNTIPERDHVAHETRPKPGREKETERYLTEQQQHAAIAFWKRHDVTFAECDQTECPCHSGVCL
jgi:hypothetical protein